MNGKDWEARSHGLIESLSWYMYGGSEKTIINLKTVCAQPRVKVKRLTAVTTFQQLNVALPMCLDKERCTGTKQNSMV
jgi:hypothetical protein